MDIFYIILYVLIVFIATCSGAIAGLGGGVIIKPLLDLINIHDATTIGFYSSVAVFTMCIVSIRKQIKGGFNFDKKTVIYISVGSMAGGYLGELIFKLVVKSYSNNIVMAIQAGLLALTLVLILIYTLNKERVKSHKIKNLTAIFMAGMFLGTISVFLGIGGGPLNVALLMYLFSYKMKEAAIYSIATIFFSQISKLVSIGFSGNLLKFDMKYIPFIIVSAVLGGYLGTIFNQKMSSKKIEKFYVILMVILLLISGYNVISVI